MSLSAAQLDEILAEARDVADDAGALLLEGLDRPKKVDLKGAVDLVTEYDRRSEELIISRLSSRFPDFGVLAEEGGHSDADEGAPRWIIDPLDGTTNFAHGHPFFAVSIGLEYEGQPVVGAISIPTLGMSAWARKGGGAFCNGDPIRVSDRTELGSCLIATGFPYDRRSVEDDNTREHRAFIKSSQGVRRCGAAAIDLAFVARAVCDGFFEPRLHAWDLAAGTILVREAGGRVTDFHGEPIDIHKGWVVASNGLIHERMLAVIKKARATL